MRLPRFRLRIEMIAVAVTGVSIGSGLALVDRQLWIERDGGLAPEAPWIESRLEWLYLGILASVTGCTTLALASALRTGRLCRLSTRDRLAIVAGTALILAGVAFLQRRSNRFREQAISHERELSKIILSDLEIYLSPYPEIHSLLEYKIYHKNLISSCELASHRPWLWVDSGPAPPVPSKKYQETLRSHVRLIRQSLRQDSDSN